MYIFPGYVEYCEESGSIYVSSKLRQNTVKLTDPQIQKEFYDIVRHGGCVEVSTPLTKFLNEQELLVNHQEIDDSVKELNRLLEDCLRLTIMPTEGCNFRCPYCYESHTPDSMRRKTLEKIFQFIEEQVVHYRSIDIAWFGGEPTLCKDVILETSAMVQHLQQKYSFLYSANMTTNGYLLSLDDFKQYYQAGIRDFQITLDGKNHDQTRPHVTGKGTLNRIIENLVAISKLDKEKYQFSIIIRHNILPQDEDYGWYDYLAQLFGSDKRFSMLVRPVGDWGGESVHSLEILKGNERDDLVLKHVEYLHKINMPCENGRKSVLSKVCYASYPHSMVFRSSGKIEKCALCLDHPKNLLGYVDPENGVILNEEINQLWTASTLKQECYHCSDVLSCLNRQCMKAKIIDGKVDFRCSSALRDIY